MCALRWAVADDWKTAQKWCSTPRRLGQSRIPQAVLEGTATPKACVEARNVCKKEWQEALVKALAVMSVVLRVGGGGQGAGG